VKRKLVLTIIKIKQEKFVNQEFYFNRTKRVLLNSYLIGRIYFRRVFRRYPNHG